MLPGVWMGHTTDQGGGSKGKSASVYDLVNRPAPRNMPSKSQSAVAASPPRAPEGIHNNRGERDGPTIVANPAYADVQTRENREYDCTEQGWFQAAEGAQRDDVSKKTILDAISKLTMTAARVPATAVTRLTRDPFWKRSSDIRRRTEYTPNKPTRRSLPRSAVPRNRTSRAGPPPPRQPQLMPYNARCTSETHALRSCLWTEWQASAVRSQRPSKSLPQLQRGRSYRESLVALVSNLELKVAVQESLRMGKDTWPKDAGA